jgi:TonB family protein
MRKTTLLGPLSGRIPLCCLLALGTIILPVCAQDAAPSANPTKGTPPALPKAPKDLLELAAQTNGLAAETVHPWHLVANVASFDNDGKETARGTYEEFWSGPRRYKIVYTAGTFSQTAVRTDDSLSLSGSSDAPPEFLVQGSNELFAPIPVPLPIADASKDKVERSSRILGSVKLDCLSLKFYHTSFGDLNGPSYCLSSGSSALRTRLAHGGLLQILYNSISSFNGHFVAQDIQAFWNGKKHLTVQITQFSNLSTTGAPETTIPADAMPAPDKMEISALTAGDLVLRSVPPNYPVEAKMQGVQGTVVLHAHVDKTGQISNVVPVSGPPLLIDAAVQAVSQWKYQPYILYGQPTGFDTTVNVIFTLG